VRLLRQLNQEQGLTVVLVPMTCSVKGWKEVRCGFLSHIRESFSLAVFFIESSKLGERFAALVSFFFFDGVCVLFLFNDRFGKSPKNMKTRTAAAKSAVPVLDGG